MVSVALTFGSEEVIMTMSIAESGRKQMARNAVNVAEAKKHLSELLGLVAFGKEQIIITKRGKPMAKLVPVEEESRHLADARGWLEETDEFFEQMEAIVASRPLHEPRMVKARQEDEIPS